MIAINCRRLAGKEGFSLVQVSGGVEHVNESRNVSFVSFSFWKTKKPSNVAR